MLGSYNSVPVCSYLKHTPTLPILSRLSDIMTCGASFNIQSEDSIYLRFGTL